MDIVSGDTALVEAARSGDRDAFASLLHRHWPSLVRLCRQALNGDSLADDAAQEAALRALLSIDRLRQPEQFGSWLTGIGLNVCRTWLRSRSRERPLDQELRNLHDHTDLQAEAEAADLALRLRDAVECLPEGQRDAVLQFYLLDASYAETASSLGIPLGAVRTRLHKARQALRAQLHDVYKEERMTSNGEAKEYICSFCSKPRDEVRRMIAGPNGVMICNECVELCTKIIQQEERNPTPA